MTFIVNSFSLLLLQIGFCTICFLIGNNLVLYAAFRNIMDTKLNALEVLCYSIISGMALIVVFLEFFSFLRIPIIIVFTLLLIISLMVLIYRFIQSRKLKNNLTLMKCKPSYVFLIMICLIVIVNVLSFNIPAGLAGSTNSDGAYATFVIRVILDNGYVVSRPVPYLEYLLFHPSGPHLLGALMCLIGLVPIQASVVSLGAIFPALIVLAGYSFTRTTIGSEYTSFFAAVLLVTCHNLWHPLSYTFTVQMMEFVILAVSGLLHWIQKQGTSIKRVFISGLLMSLPAYIHPVAVVYVVLLAGIPFIVNLIHTVITNRSDIYFKKGIYEMAAILALTFVFWIPFGFVTFQFLTDSTAGLPSDWIIPMMRETWDSSNPYGLFSPYVTQLGPIWNPMNLIQEATRHGGYMFLGPFCVILALCLWLIMPESYRSRDKIKESCLLSFSFFTSFLLVLIYLNCTPYFVTISVLFHPPRVWEMMFILLTVMSALTLKLIVSLVTLIGHGKKTGILIDTPVVHYRTLLVSLLLILSGSLLIITPLYKQEGPAVIQTHVENTANYLRQYNRLTPDDMQVFEWIIENTSEDAVFLVNQVDAGEYLTSVTQRQSVYPFGAAADCREYRLLTLGLTADPSNPYLLTLLANYNISYVFAGSLLANESTPTWENELTRRGGWTYENLSISPFLAKTYHSGRSAIFKVLYDNYTTMGPTIAAMGPIVELSSCESLNGWIGVRTEPYVDEEIFLQGIKPNSIGANMLINSYTLLQMNESWMPSENGQILIWVHSDSECTLLIVLGNPQYEHLLYHSVHLESAWNIVIIDLKQAGIHPNDNIKSIVFSLEDSTQNSSIINIGFIASVDREVELNTTVKYSEELDKVEYELYVRQCNSCIILLPDYFKLKPTFPSSVSWNIFPNNVLWLKSEELDVFTVYLTNDSLDPRSQVLRLITRPLKTSFIFNENASRLLPTQKSSMVRLWQSESFEILCNIPWGATAIDFSTEPIVDGIVYLPFFFSGWASDGELVITIYKNSKEAIMRNVEPHFKIVLNQTLLYRWVILSFSIEGFGGFSFRIDNHGAMGSLYLSPPLVFSNGLYF